MIKAAALAMQHLNLGDGSLVKELAGLNETCNLRFTTEFIGTEESKNTAVDLVLKNLNNEDGNDSPFQPCAFQGAYESGVTSLTSILTGLDNYMQSMYSFIADAPKEKRFTKSLTTFYLIIWWCYLYLVPPFSLNVIHYTIILYCMATSISTLF